MARTTLEIPLCGKDIDTILHIINSLMISNKYSKKILKGEEVWVKGDGLIQVRQCFSATFTADAMILQGWIGDAITGESDLDGFRAMFPKRKMKALMEEIKAKIYKQS